MNPRIATGAIGAIMLLLGLAGLFSPERVMGMLGFAVANQSSAAAVFGEVRATFGGLFVAAGAYTLWAATDPFRNRAIVFFVALLWLGAAGGRLFSVFVDGNPGLFGWASVVFEVVCGGVLLLAWQAARPSGAYPS